MQTTKVPLFISRHSLSARSAIGVQTRRLAEANDDWLHFHWWTSEFRRVDARSVLLDNWVLSRFSPFKRSRWAKKMVAALHVGHWRGNRLRDGCAQGIRDRYAGRISCIYAAPLDEEDAMRCRSILELFDVPFVLHIWDFLDGGMEQPGTLWLLENAARVYTLSEPILEWVFPKRRDARELLFSRSASATSAAPPLGGALIINLIGDVGSYAEGLTLLDEALTALEGHGIECKVQFVGSARALRRVQSPLVKRTKALGFMASDADRDAALSSGHISYLPGPHRDPLANFRSAYSIPSRILDYFAVGSPIVGVVHPASAAARFLMRCGIDDGPFNTTAAELASALETRLGASRWREESRKSARAFSLLAQSSAPQQLKRDMQALAPLKH